VPLWIDTKVYHPVVGNEPVRLRREHGLGDAFVVAYTGNIGIPQGLDVLLDAAVELQKRGVQGVKFALVGGGAQRDQLMQRAKEQRLADVVFVPPQPMQAMNAWMAASDALVLHLDHAEFREGTVPGKLFYYMAAGRPVIAAAIGETADVVRACDCGLPVPPRNAVAMADAVQQMAASRKKREQWGRNGRKAALEIYDKERVLAKMEAELVAASASKMRPEA
jgi:colanic acid biosynthesis glycosyl transferase WcaI